MALVYSCVRRRRAWRKNWDSATTATFGALSAPVCSGRTFLSRCWRARQPFLRGWLFKHAHPRATLPLLPLKFWRVCCVLAVRVLPWHLLLYQGYTTHVTSNALATRSDVVGSGYSEQCSSLRRMANSPSSPFHLYMPTGGPSTLWRHNALLYMA